MAMTNTEESYGNHDIQLVLQQQLGMQPAAGVLSHAELLNAIAARVAELIKEGPEPFYRVMYRLDISESSIRQMGTEEDVAMATALLIYRRQLEKLESRIAHRKNMDNDSVSDPDLRW
jgi:hypothetical protein